MRQWIIRLARTAPWSRRASIPLLGGLAGALLTGGLLATSAPAAATSAAVSGTAASALKNCVTIAGVESSGSKINLDPDNQPSSQSSLYVDATHDRLLNKNNNFDVSPSLATSYSSNKSATVWTFHLRHGVKFQDGKPFTSASVVYTYRRLINPKSNSEAVAAMSQFLTPRGIQARGPYTVVFKTKQPSADFPVLITTKDTWIVENGASNATIASTGAGTGPFIPVNFAPGASTYTFRANPHYWRKGYPKASCLQFTVVQSAASGNAAVQTGQVDLLQSVDLSTVSSLKRATGVKLMQTPPATSITLAMNMDVKPFDNNLVRTALKDVVNRQQMLQVALFGYGSVGDDNPTPPTSPNAWRSRARQQNIPEAKKLLTQAGYTSSHPLKVTLYSGNYITGGLKVAELFKQQAAQAGIQVNLITTPGSTYFANTWPKTVFRGAAWSLRPPSVSLPLEYIGPPPLSGNNDSHWKNAKFTKILSQAAATINSAKRVRLYKQAEQMISLQGGEIIPVFFSTVAAMRTSCTGYTPSDDFNQYDFSALTCKR